MTIRWKLWAGELFVIAAKMATGRSAVKTVSLDIRPCLILNWVFTSIAPLCCTKSALHKSISNPFRTNLRNPIWSRETPHGKLHRPHSTTNCWNLNSFFTPKISRCFVVPILLWPQGPVHLDMSLDLNPVLVLDLGLDQVIQSMWRPYKAIKCGSANEEILSKWLECRQGCKKRLSSQAARRAIASFMAAQKINPKNFTFV